MHNPSICCDPFAFQLHRLVSEIFNLFISSLLHEQGPEESSNLSFVNSTVEVKRDVLAVFDAMR